MKGVVRKGVRICILFIEHALRNGENRSKLQYCSCLSGKLKTIMATVSFQRPVSVHG